MAEASRRVKSQDRRDFATAALTAAVVIGVVAAVGGNWLRERVVGEAWVSWFGTLSAQFLLADLRVRVLSCRITKRLCRRPSWGVGSLIAAGIWDASRNDGERPASAVTADMPRSVIESST